MDGPHQKLTRIAEFIDAFQVLEREDPTAAACIRLLLTGKSIDQNSVHTDSVDSDGPAALWGDTHFERICQLYCQRKNGWLSVSDIRLGTEIGRGAIAQVLYTTYKDCFERKPHPSHAKMKVWRLTGAAYSEAKTRAEHHYQEATFAEHPSTVSESQLKEPVMMH
ncbi:MAG: hypothetical protein AAGB26_12630 [Planctomycetota bacterium]